MFPQSRSIQYSVHLIFNQRVYLPPPSDENTENKIRRSKKEGDEKRRGVTLLRVKNYCKKTEGERERDYEGYRRQIRTHLDTARLTPSVGVARQCTRCNVSSVAKVKQTQLAARQRILFTTY